MHKSSYVLTVLFLLLTNTARPDVKIEGTVTRQFCISNTDNFPGFSFYYTYQSYHYDKGYHANPVDTMMVEMDKWYSAASRGNSKTALLAKDGAGNWSVSDIMIGGEANTSPGIKALTDVYKIVSIDNNLVKLKKEKEITQNSNGKEKVIKAGGGFWETIGKDGFAGGLAIVSLAALFLLLLVFMLRKKRQSYSAMTN